MFFQTYFVVWQQTLAIFIANKSLYLNVLQQPFRSVSEAS